MSAILEQEILTLTKALRIQSKKLFGSDSKATAADHKTMREIEKQIDNKIKELDKAHAAGASNEFEVRVQIAFDKKGDLQVRPLVPGGIIASTAVDVLYSTAENLKAMLDSKSQGDELAYKTLKVAELYK
ncbi:MAG: hypothetical protein EOO42_04330 [Flavobacteriales bacterium]|nr:MAG: hypothetical protein EOO42_04330 [Flavobacteriales bacterium]